jgi:hypothetical protein
MEKDIDLPLAFQTFHEPAFKLPAGHLPKFNLAGKFIGGNRGIVTYHINNAKSLRDRDVATMKNGMCGS